jgi:tetratricopeptide (TPR) repeat protein
MSVLATAYADANEVDKAVDILEKAYVERSEEVGPDDEHLQGITILLCQMLAVEGEYDRMLEYLEVTMDGTKWFFDHPDPKSSCHISNPFELWFSAVASSFKCLSFLPLDHAQRRAMYARTFQMAIECVQACIRDAPKSLSSSSESEWISRYSTAMFNEIWIPLDIEYDYEELLRLLSELYDLYRSYLDQHQSPSNCKVLLLRLGCLYDEMVTIYNCARSRVLEGLITPTSIDEGLFNSVIARLDDYKNIESTTA